MMQQTFEALESNFAADNDACIDCAKSIVEVVCRAIVDELDDAKSPIKPKDDNPSFASWVSAAVRILKLGDDVRDTAFQKLVSQHHKLTTTLMTLRNDGGPVSHGRDGFINRLSAYHRRSAVLSADAIVAFLHQAYREAELNLARTREPYERFEDQNNLIDNWCGFADADIEDGSLNVTVGLPDGAESLVIAVTPSQLLFQLDRQAYIEALNAARSAEAFGETSEGTPA